VRQRVILRPDSRLRVVSLLPAATEIVAALGLTDSLVGVSHDCDYPPAIDRKPRVTHCDIHDSRLPSAAVDAWVADELAGSRPLYTVDAKLLRELAPDVIITQQLCDVCAPDYASVVQLAASLPKPPKVVDLSPSSIADIFGDIKRVASALGRIERGDALVSSLQARVERVRAKAAAATTRPRCCHLEWIDPLFCSGHWTPELVEVAGGIDPLGRKHLPSVRISRDALRDAQPQILVLACCGYDVARTLQDVAVLESMPGWETLPAVVDGRVHAVDGSAYFSRPGPRIVDSLEILATLIHPELFARRPQGAVTLKRAAAV